MIHIQNLLSITVLSIQNFLSPGTFTTYGTAFGQGDVIGCKLDLVNRSISFTINGADHGEAFKIAPHLQRSGFYAAVCLKASTVRVVFSGEAAPQGFTWIGRAEARDVVTAAGIECDEGSKGATPLCIILEPSRDLAEQTFRCLLDYKKHMPAPALEAVLLVGGTDVGQDVKALKGGAHIAVGTPGRMEELVSKGALSCRRVRVCAGRVSVSVPAVCPCLRRPCVRVCAGRVSVSAPAVCPCLPRPCVRVCAGRVCAGPACRHTAVNPHVTDRASVVQRGVRCHMAVPHGGSG
jgi:ATP-dependent RNA helicase DDX1